MIDDDDDKIRRNLVVFCALALGAAFLNIPVGAVTAHFIDKESGGIVSSARVWALAAAVLLYLSVRFELCGGGAETIELLSRNYRFTITGTLHVRATADVDKFQRTGESGFMHPPFSNIVAGMQSEFKDDEPRLQFINLGEPRLTWFGTAYPGTFTFITRNGRLVERGASLIYRPPGAWLMWIKLSYAVKTWLYSRESVQQFFPIAFCLGATAVISFKLTSSLFSSG